MPRWITSPGQTQSALHQEGANNNSSAPPAVEDPCSKTPQAAMEAAVEGHNNSSGEGVKNNAPTERCVPSFLQKRFADGIIRKPLFIAAIHQAAARAEEELPFFCFSQKLFRIAGAA